MDFNTTERLATIAHPKFPEVRATIRELTPIEKLDFRSRYGKALTEIALCDPEGRVVRDEEGRAETVRKFLDGDRIDRDLLRKTIKEVVGISENGNPIPATDFDRLLPYLQDPRLNVPVLEPRRDRRTGEPVGEPVQNEISYADFLLRQMKDPEVFDPDPPESSSPQPQIVS